MRKALKAESSSVRIAVIGKVGSSNRRGDVFRSEHFCSETVALLVQFAHALLSLNCASEHYKEVAMPKDTGPFPSLLERVAPFGAFAVAGFSLT